MSRTVGKNLRGYTLIEMLISVTIFSGLLIIVLGVVATSSSSSAKVSVLREKSQAARALIDQISNDFRYADTSISLKVDSDPTEYKGYFMTSERLVLAMHLPNTAKDSELVRKEYNIGSFNSRTTVTLTEARGCKAVDYLNFNSCDQKSTQTDVLSSAYVLSQEAPNFSSEFGGLMVGENPQVTPFVSLVFTIKPFDLAQACSEADSGSCYKVSTTINNAGVSQ